MRTMKKKRLELDFAMRVASEHLSYRSLIEEIEGDLERVRAGGASTAGLLALLEGFQAQVRNHFALEERGGLFEVYRENARDFGKHAAAMLAQHGDFLARLALCLALARALEAAGGPEFERLAAELRALFRDLREHERAEDELLARLVEQDIR